MHKHVSKRLPFEQLHSKESNYPIGIVAPNLGRHMPFQIKRPANVRVSNSSCGINFSPKAHEHFWIVRNISPDCFYRDGLCQLLIKSFIHLPHSTLSKVPGNFEAIAKCATHRKQVRIWRSYRRGAQARCKWLEKRAGFTVSQKKFVDFAL